MTSRRDFLRMTSAAAAAVGARGWVPAAMRHHGLRQAAIDADYKALALRAVDAARSAGASYADVRITRFRYENIQSSMSKIGLAKNIGRGDQLAFGVRVLVDGYWGFVAGRETTVDEAVRLVRAAVAQARGNRWGMAGDVNLASAAPVNDETWTTPIERDPFDVPIDEKMGYLVELEEAAFAIPDVVWALSSLNFRRTDKTFASTDGSLFVQTTYLSAPGFGLFVADPANETHQGTSAADVSAMGMGYELLNRVRIKEQIPHLVEEARFKLRPQKNATVGKYDLVFDARTLSSIFADTIGGATEFDRALGYEANAGGTSYLAPPQDMLGKFRLGSPLLSVRADRSQPGSCARVRWDDEGVAPDEFMLVEKGIVTDYQTIRAQAPLLGSWYAARGTSVRSHGCAVGESGFDTVMQHRPNLSMVPGDHETSFTDLVATTAKGFAFTGGGAGFFDQQLLNGEVFADMVYEIKDGKLGGLVSNSACLIRAPEFWKSLVALGGARSARLAGTESFKGEPSQSSTYSVRTVPAKFAKVSVINSGPRGARER